MFKPPRLLYFMKANLNVIETVSLSVWSWDFQGWSCNLCQRKCCLCSLLAVLWCHVFYLTLGAMLSLFLCMVWGCDLTSWVYMRLSRYQRRVRRNNSRKNEEMEPKWKQCPAVDVTGDGSKVQCCKEQYCIGTWNARSMNQGTLEVVK